ncbi:MAG: hypothetical protein ACXVDD_02975 [Polyangia bacterium]
MQDAHDFSLRIVVTAPERRVVVVADEHATTLPFARANLPGVDLRPAQERTSQITRPPAPVGAEPLAPSRHAWLPSHSGQKPVPSRLKARSLLGVPPPPPARAAPLSDDDERRMERRARAYRRMAWAQRLLERFQFVEAS